MINGKYMREQRLNAGVSVTEAAKGIGCNPSSLLDWELHDKQPKNQVHINKWVGLFTDEAAPAVEPPYVNSKKVRGPYKKKKRPGDFGVQPQKMTTVVHTTNDVEKDATVSEVFQAYRDINYFRDNPEPRSRLCRLLGFFQKNNLDIKHLSVTLMELWKN